MLQSHLSGTDVIVSSSIYIWPSSVPIKVRPVRHRYKKKAQSDTNAFIIVATANLEVLLYGSNSWDLLSCSIMTR